jgi:SAM-dependent methyltransferase
VASDYAAYRPRYPEALFDWLASRCHHHDVAWDCACGSGQASHSLAPHFDLVVGTDASPSQVAAAPAIDNADFVIAESEFVPLVDHSVDLVTVAAALHWFATDRFFDEVRRVARPGGVVAAWSYGMPRIEIEEVEMVVHEFIDVTLGPFWPPEIQMVLDGYASIAAPFEEIETPSFELNLEWPVEKFLRFANTWSAVTAYFKAEGEEPVPLLAAELGRLWKDEGNLLPLTYDLGLRAWRV